jgi:hypothetical protein
MDTKHETANGPRMDTNETPNRRMNPYPPMNDRTNCRCTEIGAVGASLAPQESPGDGFLFVVFEALL